MDLRDELFLKRSGLEGQPILPPIDQMSLPTDEIQWIWVEVILVKCH